MIICLCEALSDRDIREVVSEGHRTMRQVAKACGAGTGCGACTCDVRRLVEEAPQEAAAAAPPTHMILRR